MTDFTPYGQTRSRPLVHVAVVVVTYNSEREIGNLLESLSRDESNLIKTILVVDNLSQDRTVEIASDYRCVTVIRNDANAGYAGGINVALRALPAEVDAVAVLNPDVVVQPDALAALVSTLADPTVGVAVPRILDWDGSLTHSLHREPTIASAIGDAVFGSHLRRRTARLSETVWSPGTYGRDTDVDWASGAAWAISRECLDAAGPWKEDYFLYSEEVEFARRVRALGFRLRYTSSAVVRHVGGASGRSPQLDALLAMNRVRDFACAHGRVRGAVFGSAVLLHHLARTPSAKNREVFRLLVRPSSWTTPPRALVAPSGSEA
jgi:N-acetylglucosaminyl-diphospho-decaprenol L-rhamnosyltransferase